MVTLQEGYHNVFGYMEDIYHAHDQFWTWTMEPVLEKVLIVCNSHIVAMLLEPHAYMLK